MKTFFQLFLTISLLISCNAQDSKTKKSIAEAIAILPNASIKETIAYYHKLKKEQPTVYNFKDESELNKLGYQYLNNGKVKSAIEIFKLLVSEFPNSSNPYDSLGEAYQSDGNTNLAIKNYEKSLALDPKNSNAEKMIFKIKYNTGERPKFSQIFSKQQYLEDMDELANRIVGTHPKPFEFITKKAFFKLVQIQKEKIKERMTYGEFIWELSPIIASVGCEHSHFDVFNQEDRMLPVELRFPLEAQLINSKLLVTNSRINNKRVAIGSSIKTINGKTIKELTNDIFKHIASNGYSKSLKRKVFSAYITSYIPYYFGFPKSYEIVLERENKKVKLTQLKEFNYLQRDNEPSFKFYKKRNYAKLRIPFFSAYGGEKLKQYEEFISSGFRTLNKKRIKNLIIDIRGNGGGCSCGAIYLLQHISKKPFTYFSPDLPVLPGDKSEDEEKSLAENHFSGDTYMLIDGFNTSTSGHLLSLVKENSMATLIGEESGASYYANGNVKGFLGSNTGVGYWISQTYYETTASNFPKNKGILPDLPISKTSIDIVKNIDTQMEYVLKLINKK